MSVQTVLEDFQELALPDLKKRHESKLARVLKRHRERINYILKVRKRAEEHKKTEKRRTNTYSHMSGDPGDFERLGFTGYSHFFSLPREERNERLDKIIETWEEIFDKEKLKENRRQARLYGIGLPYCQSETKLKEAYQDKKGEIEEKFEIEGTEKRLERLETAIERISSRLHGEGSSGGEIAVKG